MRNICRVCLILLLAGSTAPAASAQPEPGPTPHPGPIRFYHQQAAPDHEDPSRMRGAGDVAAILQDHEGFMWFGDNGNMGGHLNRYDGHTYANFAYDPYDSTSLGAEGVRVIYEDREQTLWVGTWLGLYRCDRLTETFQRFEHDPNDPASISPGAVWDILDDRQGTFWVATAGGLSRMDRQAGTFTRYLPDSTDTPIRVLLEDRQGTLWVGTWGLCRFDPASGTPGSGPGQACTRYLPDPSRPQPGTDLETNRVHAIHEDPKGRLWVGTQTGGLYLFDPVAETFTNYRHDPALPLPFTGDSVNEIVDDPEGGLWLATRREGLVWFDPETGRMTAYRHDELNPYSLNSDGVQSLYKDSQGLIWVSAGGVYRFDRSARPFEYYYARRDGEGGLLNDNAMAMAEAPDGVLWVKNGGNLTAIDRETGTFRHFRPDPNDPRSLDWGRTANVAGAETSMFVDASGVVWTGGGGVLSRMDPDRPGRFTHFRHDPEDESGLPPGNNQRLFEDSKGRLWIASSGFGLSRMDDRERGVFTRFPLDEGMRGINILFEDAEGMLWAGTYGGLYRIDPETGRYENYRRDPDDPNSLAGNQIVGIWERPQEPGVLWLGINPIGLGRFEPATGVFRLYTTRDGLDDNHAMGVLGDEQGHLWISTDYGLSRFDPDTGTFTNYHVDDGLGSEDFWAWSFHKGRSGQLYFGGGRGLNAIYPDQVRGNPYPPEVVLTKLRLGREMVEPHPDGPLKQRLNETTELTLTHDRNDLTLFYEGLHFRQPEKNRYRYMLEGYDDTWSVETSIRQATYTNLPPGTYTFRAKASNSDGVWNEEGAQLSITILPPWWRTRWAYALYGLLAIGAVAGAFRYQRQRLLRKAEIEQARLRAEAAELQARALEEENKRKAVELEKAHELEAAYTELDRAHHHLKTTQKQLIQQEKMASLGQLTAGIAHEIKNPLNFVNNFAEVNEELADELCEDLADYPQALAAVDDLLADLKQNAQVIAQHGMRADGIVRAMMQHASVGQGRREEIDLNALVSEHIDLAYHGKRAQVPALQVEIHRDLGPDVEPVSVVPQEIGRVLLNLLSNAFDAVQERADAGTPDQVRGRQQGHGDPGSGSGQAAVTVYTPTVTVATQRTDAGVVIRISDNGAGIPHAVREKIFEPFFTTKPTGSGTGLGLSLAYDIVTQGHGGTLTVGNTEGQGATFVITLPTDPQA